METLELWQIEYPKAKTELETKLKRELSPEENKTLGRTVLERIMDKEKKTKEDQENFNRICGTVFVMTLLSLILYFNRDIGL